MEGVINAKVTIALPTYDEEVTLLELSCRIYKIFTSGQYGGLSGKN